MVSSRGKPRLPSLARRETGSVGAGRSDDALDVAEIEPAVLLVGADSAFHEALAKSLATHRVFVETASVSTVLDSVVAAAPDLILLTGEAARDAGISVLHRLSNSPQSSVIPVVIITDEKQLDERLDAFRHGAAAVIPRSASVDAIASRVAQLAREIPEREGESLGDIGEATLEELVNALSRELRSGILSISSGKDEAVRIVLGGGKPLAQTIDEFVSRLRGHVLHAEPLRYEFDERAGGTVQMFGGESILPPSGPEEIAGLRAVLADDDAARADGVAQALRSHDASVVVASFEPDDLAFSRLRQLDPALLIIDEEHLRGPGFQLVRRMRRDTRLRWASLLVVNWSDVWSNADDHTGVEAMLGTLATLTEAETSLRDRARAGIAFDTRLEITGPARLLRALVTCPNMVRVSVINPRVYVQVDLSRELVVGASAELQGDMSKLEGTVALSALLQLSSGRVHVERVTDAQFANVMATVDVALAQADGEAPPISPSVPAGQRALASLPPARPSTPPAAAAKTGVLDWLSSTQPKEQALLALAAVLFLVVAGLAVTTLTAEAPVAPEPSRVVVSHEAQNPMPPPSAMPAPVSSPGEAPSEPSAIASAAEPSEPVTEADPKAPDDEPRPKANSLSYPALLALESTKSVDSCEVAVGAGWSLLQGDMAGQSHIELLAGRKALVKGDLPAAHLALCRASAMDFTNVEAVSYLIRLYLLMRDVQKAHAWADRAAKRHVDNTGLQSLLGDALARKGDILGATTLWTQIAAIDSTNPDEVRNLAHTYALAGERAAKGSDYAQADRFYRRAAVLDPESHRAAAGLGEALLWLKELPASEAWLKRAVDVQPQNSQMQLLYGDALDRNGKKDEAVHAWQVAVSLDPHNARAQRRLIAAGARP